MKKEYLTSSKFAGFSKNYFVKKAHGARKQGSPKCEFVGWMQDVSLNASNRKFRTTV
jgi:hypothetical protein